MIVRHLKHKTFAIFAFGSISACSMQNNAPSDQPNDHDEQTMTVEEAIELAKVELTKRKIEGRITGTNLKRGEWWVFFEISDQPGGHATVQVLESGESIFIGGM